MNPKILRGKTALCQVSKGIGEYFFEQANYFGDRTFQIEAKTGNIQSFVKVLQRSTKVALGLKRLKAKPRDIIVLCCYNDLNNIVPWLASIFLNAIVCSIDPDIDREDIDLIIKSTNPKFVFVVEPMLQTIANSLKIFNFSSVTIITIGHSRSYYQMQELEESNYKNESDFRPEKVNVKDTAFLFLSSGTTSFPKLVEVSQYRYMYHAVNILPVESTGDLNPFLQRPSLYWTVGVRDCVLSMATGIPNVLVQDIDPLETLQYLSKFKIGSLSIGAAYDLVQAFESNPDKHFDFSHLKNVTLVGNKVHKETILKLRQMFKNAQVFSQYGATELCIICRFTELQQNPIVFEKLEAVGIPAPNVEIKIVDPDKKIPLGPNEQGEILVRSPLVANGYYNSANPLPIDTDNFFQTGDLGYYDQDNFVYITDRIHSTFKVRIKGCPYMITPSLIEKQLEKYPIVKEAAVFGIPHRSLINLTVALIVLKDNNLVFYLNLNDLLNFVNQAVPKSHQITGGIKVVEKLPKTVKGKLKRLKLKELF